MSNPLEKGAQNHVQTSVEDHQGQAGHWALSLVPFTDGRQKSNLHTPNGRSTLATYAGHSPAQVDCHTVLESIPPTVGSSLVLGKKPAPGKHLARSPWLEALQ